jgi:hypothetical protein
MASLMSSRNDASFGAAELGDEVAWEVFTALQSQSIEMSWSLGFYGWPGIILWKRICDVVPLCLGANKHVISGANAGICVEWTHSDVAELSLARDTETGSTYPAEGPANARRSFIHCQKVLA